MNYKIVIDAMRGGSDTGSTIGNINEKDFNLNISKYISKRLTDLGIPNILTRNEDKYISLDDRISIINDKYGNGKDVIVISNGLNNDFNDIEIIYGLRNNNKLSYLISNALSNYGINVSKYYQLRDENDTSKDKQYLIRETENNETIEIFYGSLNNYEDSVRLNNNIENYGEAVVKGISDYLGINYIPISTNIYVVKKGDTLYSVAKKYGLTVNELKSLNNLTSNTLAIGQTLKVDKTNNTYTVKKGDTLYSIAKKYGLTVNELKSLNNLTSNTLAIGQTLKVDKTSTTYTVKKGDTLYSIAKKYGLTVNELKSLNNLTSNTLTIGQTLKVD